jgi:hypothetical protein
MFFKCLFVVLPAIIFPGFIYAQKLPNIQQISLRAPVDIKTDGKASEWNNIFQAYNHTIDIFYTLSNDDENLYLTVQATDHNIINKILGGGIILTINKADQKKIKEGVSLTYPILDVHNRVWVNLKNQSQMTNIQADSMTTIKNTEFANKSKVIGVTGLKGVDTLISVYNHDGIKASATFNNKLFFTYELSVNLKKLGLNINNPIKFSYNIKLPGVDMVAIYAAAGQATTIAEGTPYIIPIGTLPGFSEEYVEKNQPSWPYKVHQSIFTTSTDFWGEYTLAKK